MRIRVTHDLGDLADDMVAIPPQAAKDMILTVRKAGKVGNEVAKDNARRSSGTHARKYPGTFSVGPVSKFYGFGGGAIQVEYGPVARGQGMLASYLERGTRNNPPHNDLAKSADLIGPAFAHEVAKLPDKWFW